MKQYNLKYFILAFVLGLGACSEDFLETEPSQFISTDQMAQYSDQNPEIFDGTIRGLYSLMYQTGTGGIDGHDDFGQKAYDIYTDMLSGDMVLGGTNYGWFEDIATMAVTVDYRHNRNYMPWRYYYRIVRATNIIIDGLGGADATPETDKAKWQMGQAKTMRAYAYFYLANLFANEYDPAAEILPLYLTPKDVILPLSKSSDVWAAIKADLESASTLLEGYSRGGLHEANADVANGLLAYTYLTMGEYSSAAATAQKVIDSGYGVIPMAQVADGYSITRNAFSYFDGEGANWIWGMDLTLDQGLDLVSWWGQVDIFTYSYAWAGDPKTMDAGLYKSIPDTDARKALFMDPWEEGLYYPLGKFHYEETASLGKQREITADYVYMRVEEMYLIKAEAQAMAGNDVEAKAALLAVVSQRNTDVAFVDALAGQDLKDEIYHQWRMETWGEGKSYLAMKRNKATITREGHIDLNISIPFNDDRLTFEIPYQEIQDNPNINK